MRKPAWDTELATKLLDEGKTDPEVAQTLGIPVGTLKSWKQRHGMTGARTKEKQKAECKQTEQDDAGEEHFTCVQGGNRNMDAKETTEEQRKDQTAEVVIQVDGCSVIIKGQIRNAARVMKRLEGEDEEC